MWEGEREREGERLPTGEKECVHKLFVTFSVTAGHTPTTDLYTHKQDL